MGMIWRKGKTKMRWLPRTASVTFTKNDLVMLTSGLVATATAQSTKHLGVILTNVTSGDSNFATTAVKVPVEVPVEIGCEMESDVTGTLLTTDIGLAFDLSTAGLVNQDGTTYKVVTCTQYISATKGRFKLNSLEDFADATWE
jgi:hypothetical protein